MVSISYATHNTVITLSIYLFITYINAAGGYSPYKCFPDTNALYTIKTLQITLCEYLIVIRECSLSGYIWEKWIFHWVMWLPAIHEIVLIWLVLLQRLWKKWGSQWPKHVWVFIEYANLLSQVRCVVDYIIELNIMVVA